MTKTFSFNRRHMLSYSMAGCAAGLTGCLDNSFSLKKPPLSLGNNAVPPNDRTSMMTEVFGFGIRKEANSLTADSDDVRMYKDAITWMKARSDLNPLDPMGWAQHWAHHSIFCATNTFQYQIHYGWFFLPWHRAYLFNLEQKIRRVLNEPAFALPYWDWTRNQTIPDWFFGEQNPLNNPTRLQEPGDEIPLDFVHTDPSLRAKRFKHFGGRKRKRGDLQVEGTLEQSAHNSVHNWIGGEMASFDGAGNDPFFQAHHGQVDRLWEIWLRQGDGRANPKDPTWLNEKFWFFGWEGFPEAITVSALVDTKALGYVFSDYEITSTLNENNLPVYKGDGLEFGRLDPDDKLLAQIAAVKSEGAEGRVSITYERMSLPMHPFHHRLFLIDDQTGDATYLGTQMILPIPDQTRGLEKQVSSQVEFPPHAIEAVLAGRPLRVVGVPVELKGRPIPLQPVPFEGVTLSVDA